MLITSDNFDATVAKLEGLDVISIDTETNGLRPYHGDRLFCVVMADARDTYYFNFHPEHPSYLSKLHLAELHTNLFLDSTKNWVLQNAKFDMAILANEGCYFTGYIWDTKAIARVLRNDRQSLALDDLAKDMGAYKSDKVKEYILEHKLWEWVSVPGKNKRFKKMYFEKVPFEIMQEYAELDARLTYDLHLYQIKEFTKMGVEVEELKLELPDVMPVVATERKLTPALFEMEKLGVKIDRPYCDAAIEYETQRMASARRKFEELSGEKFKNSSKLFEKVFEGEKFVYGKPTAVKNKINPKFDSDVLRTFKNPLANVVLDYRDAKSRIDFYHGFLWYADEKDTIHCNFNQDGTVTGRLSSSEPNLQNLTKSEEDDTGSLEAYPIRRAITPRPGTFFAMFDYEQMEYKLLLDYIGAKGLIEKVLSGFDVHEATAQIVKLPRSQAKTVNFGLIYGQGVKLLARNLGLSEWEAGIIRETVLNAIPELADFIERVQHNAMRRGFVFNWHGRRCNFPDKRFAYRAVNHLIQGGCADVTKIAMIRVHEFLRGKLTNMVLTVHDEIVVESVRQDAKFLPEIKVIMENVYKPKHGLPLSCGVDHSYKSLADKVEGFPCQ